jgi:hypothetical protein
MKAKYLPIILFLICTQNIFAQVTFLKELNDIPVDFYLEGGYLKQTKDSGFIVTGFNMQDNQSSYGPFLMKLNIDGDTVWTKHYISTIGGSSVFQACDGGYVAIGGDGIIKTNSIGDTLWTRTYPGLGASYGFPTSDCGFMLSGFTANFGAGQLDIYIIKTDSAGNPLWIRTYGTDSTDEGGCVQQTADGGYIIIGNSNSFSVSGERRIYVIKTDVNGDTLWTKMYGLSGNTDMGGGSISQTNDNGYIISGGYWETYLIKTDSVGNITWSKTFSGVRGGGAILQAPDSGYIFACNYGNIPVDVMLIKTNSNGNILWNNVFGVANGYNSATTLFKTFDGGYALAGIGVNNSMPPVNYMFVKKTNANGLTCFDSSPAITGSSASIVASGTTTVITSPSVTVSSAPVTTSNMIVTAFTACTTASVSEERPENSSTIYPNLVPKNGSANIFIDEDLKNATVTVFNVLGIAIYSDIVSGKGKTLLATLNSKLSPGMYFIRIMQDKNIIVKKIIVL